MITQDTGVDNAREILDVLEARGVKTFFISPGSRNTPLLIGLEARTGIKKYIINDERTAAFSALGYSLASQEPAALVCTSGTAMYNYSPAIAEAFYQHVPLIAITADRPAQWIDQDDSQTLRQYGALDKIVKRSFDIHADAGVGSKCASDLFGTEKEWYANRVANEAVTIATSPTCGPVHINMQFANPLNLLTDYSPHNLRIVETVRGENRLSKQTLQLLAERIADKHVLVVAGYMPPCRSLNSAIAEFSSLPNVAVMCETISNLHLGAESFMIDSLLTQISDRELVSLRPDIIITIGGALVSRMLKEFLRKNEGSEHWSLSQTEIPADCMQRLSLHIDADPAKFFSDMAGFVKSIQKDVIKPAPTYNYSVSQLRTRAAAKTDLFIHESGWSELKALDILFCSIPENYNLFVSNGTCIRYAQLLTRSAQHACWCNRGVSGIDGSNATAFGASLAYHGTTLLLTGDMSFAYCPEILQLKNMGGDLRIVIVNNSGGGIFRFIKTTRELDIREKYFCNAPGLPLQGLADIYGWHYRSASGIAELQDAIAYLIATPRTILEIKVDAQTSAETLIKYMNL